MSLDVQAVRSQFPALRELFNGKTATFFDNPGGTQLPQRVIDAMTDYMIRRNANVHGAFETSRRTDETIDQARQASADLFGCAMDEVIFGNNMTSLAFQLSQALAREFGPADEIIVTRLDHDANIAPWARLAEDRGCQIHYVDIDVETSTLDMADLRAKLNRQTRLLALGYASNVSGTINDIHTAIGWAKEYNAYVFVDSVQYAPHGLLDVQELDCDFMACSAYKFYGPHAGLLYGKREHLNRLRSYQVRPASTTVPGAWEIGTKNHEGLAGVKAAIDYIAELGVTFGTAGEEYSRRDKLKAAWKTIHEYEKTLTQSLISGLAAIPSVRLYGISDKDALQQRVATVSIRKQGTTPKQLAEFLGQENIYVTCGNFYALSLTERLGVESSGGLLRIGLAHYNTVEEIEHFLNRIDSNI
ncbi:MAG: cysteine desulfurase-like protein [Chloroflexota bacterium]